MGKPTPPMGHRALVAVARGDDRYDLRESRWGGEDLSLPGPGATDPLVADVPGDRVLPDHADPWRYEALFVVRSAVASYRVRPLGWCVRPPIRGAIVAVDPAADCEFRTWFRATKSVLGDCVDAGLLDERVAQSYLEGRLRVAYPARGYTFG
ncbi:DUF6735 family protein [Saliphagus sp. LR7]|uniref:DUF6735 family protein n=1 Tax=Saliphagus sp. LR7 TaxID=2282654 RepID=UPI001E584107|nr:DUF6735 family protein [Saliphagus sp. LR7]